MGDTLQDIEDKIEHIYKTASEDGLKKGFITRLNPDAGELGRLWTAFDFIHCPETGETA